MLWQIETGIQEFRFSRVTLGVVIRHPCRCSLGVVCVAAVWKPRERMISLVHRAAAPARILGGRQWRAAESWRCRGTLTERPGGYLKECQWCPAQREQREGRSGRLEQMCQLYQKPKQEADV